MHIYDVIIVGAGIAGLSASKTLLESGIGNIVILEAKEKPGGRIQTIPSGNSHLELGAQWVHGDENEFFDLVKNYGHIHGQLSWEAKGIFATPTGEKVPDTLVHEILEWVDHTLEHIEENFSIETLLVNVRNPPANDSVGSFLRESFEKYLESEYQDAIDLKRALFQWAMNFQRIDNSCHRMTDLSLFRWSEFKINGGDLHHNFKSGADTFVQDAFHEIIKSPLLKLNTAAVKIIWNTKDDLVEIQTASGEIFTTRTALITVSIGVLQSDQILFEPTLPQELTNAIQSTGFGPVTKIYLEWEKQWWTSIDSEAPFQGLQLVWPNEFLNSCDSNLEPKPEIQKDSTPFPAWVKDITGFDPVLDNPNVLLAWVGGEEALTVENLEPNEVGFQCSKVLREFTRIAIPEPTRVLISKWNSDPFFRGAYCFRSTAGDQIPGDISGLLSKPVCSVTGKPVLLLAGEANHRTQYSTLHGAFNSGKTQGQVLIEYFHNQHSTAF